MKSYNVFYLLAFIFLMSACAVNKRNRIDDCILTENVLVSYSNYKKTDLRFQSPAINYILIPKGVNLKNALDIGDGNHQLSFNLTSLGAYFVSQSQAAEVRFGCCHFGNIKNGVSDYVRSGNKDSVNLYYKDSMAIIDSALFNDNSSFKKIESKGYVYEIRIANILGDFCHCTDWHPFEAFAFENANDSICVIKRIDSIKNLSSNTSETMFSVFTFIIKNAHP